MLCKVTHCAGGTCFGQYLHVNGVAWGVHA